jgi:hypothetical protein
VGTVGTPAAPNACFRVTPGSPRRLLPGHPQRLLPGPASGSPQRLLPGHPAAPPPAAPLFAIHSSLTTPHPFTTTLLTDPAPTRHPPQPQHPSLRPPTISSPLTKYPQKLKVRRPLSVGSHCAPCLCAPGGQASPLVFGNCGPPSTSLMDRTPRAVSDVDGLPQLGNMGPHAWCPGA